MPTQVFVDDSGGKGQGPIFLLESLSMASERWASFSDRWAACLQANPTIAYFKMNEAAHLSGQFASMSRQQRDDKLCALVEVINAFRMHELRVSLDLEEFGRTIALEGSRFVIPTFSLIYGLSLRSPSIYPTKGSENALRSSSMSRRYLVNALGLGTRSSTLCACPLKSKRSSRLTRCSGMTRSFCHSRRATCSRGYSVVSSQVNRMTSRGSWRSLDPSKCRRCRYTPDESSWRGF